MNEEKLFNQLQTELDKNIPLYRYYPGENVSFVYYNGILYKSEFGFVTSKGTAHTKIVAIEDYPELLFKLVVTSDYYKAAVLEGFIKNSFL